MEQKQTKQEIFVAAIEMFSTVGYTESTMRELAKRVGIKAASLYYYYPSKDALLDEVFDYFIINDAAYRTPTNQIVDAARNRSPAEILAMSVITYKKDTQFMLMSKILRIAIGYQFENKRAREVFNWIYYDLALRKREDLFMELIRQSILESFNYKAVAYIITSYSLGLFMQCANRELPIEEFTDIYNTGMLEMTETIAPLLHRCADKA